jgi:hypothetical protein
MMSLSVGPRGQSGTLTPSDEAVMVVQNPMSPRELHAAPTIETSAIGGRPRLIKSREMRRNIDESIVRSRPRQKNRA